MKDQRTLTGKVAAMDHDAFERWMKRHGYRGMAAVRLSQKRRAALESATLSQPQN